ncbi:MAG TPA: M56 family metallopeptidase [Verrucomicrobiae bacterium]|nr:M56 family metallopeptidase [Verrucomicrobiae bacterium]
MNPDADILSHRLLAALFNGLYQGVLLTLMLWLGLKLCQTLNATTRYAACFGTLLVVTLLPCVHLMLASESNFSRSGEGAGLNSVVVRSGANAPEPVTIENQLTFQLAPSASQPDETRNEGAAHHANERIPGTSQLAGAIRERPLSKVWAIGSEANDSRTFDATAPASTIGSPSIEEVASLVVPGGVEETSTASTTALPFARLRSWSAELPSAASLLLLSLVAAIAGGRVIWLLTQCILLLRLKQRSQPTEPAINLLCTRLANEMHVGRPVVARESDGIRTPIAIGFLRPAVLLPRGFAADLAPVEFESVLRHELAHLRRRDDWTNLFQQCVAAVLFFHPAVWWLSRRLTIEREIACDDFAFTSAGSARNYALLLTEFAGRTRGHDWAAAPAAWSSKNQLKERIDMLLNTKRNTSTRLAFARTGVLTTAAIAAATVAILAGPRLVLAEPTDQKTDPASADEVVAVEVARDVTVPVSVSADINIVHDERAHRAVVEVAPVANIEARVKGASPNPVIARSLSGAASISAPAPAAPPAALRLAQAPTPAPKPRNAPRPAPAPSPDAMPSPAAPREVSLEQRLQHLENLVHSLLNERAHWTPGEPPVAGVPGLAWSEDEKLKDKFAKAEMKFHSDFKFHAPDMKNHPAWPLGEKEQAEIEKAMQQAEKEIARAMKDAEHAMRDADRQAREQRRSVEVRVNPNRDRSHQVEQQRRAIEQQRETLEQQMRQLEKQLGKLEAEMEQLDERFEEELEIEESADSLPEGAPEAGLRKPAF